MNCWMKCSIMGSRLPRRAISSRNWLNRQIFWGRLLIQLLESQSKIWICRFESLKGCRFLFVFFFLLCSMAHSLPTGQLSAIPWRRTGVKYTNNEAYFDVVEEVDAIIDKSGSTVFAEIQGYVSIVLGRPQSTLALKFELFFSSTAASNCPGCLIWRCRLWIHASSTTSPSTHAFASSAGNRNASYHSFHPTAIFG